MVMVEKLFYFKKYDYKFLLLKIKKAKNIKQKAHKTSHHNDALLPLPGLLIWFKFGFTA